LNQTSKQARQARQAKEQQKRVEVCAKTQKKYQLSFSLPTKRIKASLFFVVVAIAAVAAAAKAPPMSGFKGRTNERWNERMT